MDDLFSCARNGLDSWKKWNIRYSSPADAEGPIIPRSLLLWLDLFLPFRASHSLALVSVLLPPWREKEQQPATSGCCAKDWLAWRQQLAAWRHHLPWQARNDVTRGGAHTHSVGGARAMPLVGDGVPLSTNAQ